MKLTAEVLKKIEDNAYESDTLDLSNELLSPDDIANLSNALKKNTTIRKIALSHSLIDNKKLLVLVDALKQRGPLVGGLELNLRGNMISEAGISALASLKDLKALDVGYNQKIGLKEAETLAKLPGLSKLGLGGHELGDGVLKLFEGNASLIELDLNTNNLDADNGDLKYVLDIPTLTTLNLGVNRISNKGLVMLKGNQHLQHLDLSSNSISQDGLSVLGETKIEGLTLDRVWMTDTGLGDLLETNERNGATIRRLELFQTEVTEEGRDAVFKKYPNLESVKLDSDDKENPYRKASIPSTSSSGPEVKLHFHQPTVVSPAVSASPTSPVPGTDAKGTASSARDGFFPPSKTKSSSLNLTVVPPRESVSPKSPLSDADGKKGEEKIMTGLTTYLDTLSLEEVPEFKKRVDKQIDDLYERKKLSVKGTTITGALPGTSFENTT